MGREKARESPEYPYETKTPRLSESISSPTLLTPETLLEDASNGSEENGDVLPQTAVRKKRIRKRYCCVPGCTSCSSEVVGLSLYMFPPPGEKLTIKNYLNKSVEVDRREEWLRRLQIEPKKCDKLAICGLHFVPEAIGPPGRNRKRRCLKRWAIPSRRLPRSVETDLVNRIPVVRLSDFRKKTQSTCDLRSNQELLDTILEKEKIPLSDMPSEDEEDAEFYQAESDSEEDAEDDLDFETPEASPAEIRSEDRQDSGDEAKRDESQSADKRTNPISGSPVKDTAAERKIIRGKNGYRWYATPGQRELPIMRHIVGPLRDAALAKTPLAAWRVLMDDAILDTVILHTNEQINLFCESLKPEMICCGTYRNVARMEMNAFLGLLYFFGLQKATNANLVNLWSEEFGSTLYRATMPLERFQFLLSMLRFDGASTRAERKTFDKFGPIRDVWDAFLTNCARNYSPHAVCTIDDQLLGFQGRCPFKTRMPSKPDKLGIKIVTMHDAETLYMYTAEAPVGKAETAGIEADPSYYVRELSRPLWGSWRTIVADSWFTSVETVRQMREEFSLTMVGATRKSEREIPEGFERAGAVGTAKVAYDDAMTLVSYTPRAEKVSLVLSSLHATDATDEKSGQPEVMKMYNSAKDAGELFGRLCREYSTARDTLRWPTRVWLGMLDQAATNAMIVYNSIAKNEKMTQSQFLKSLIMGLVDPQLRVRLTTPTLRSNLHIAIACILREAPPDPELPKITGAIRSCYLCPREIEKRVQFSCAICQRAMCKAHCVRQCTSCSLRAHD